MTAYTNFKLNQGQSSPRSTFFAIHTVTGQGTALAFQLAEILRDSIVYVKTDSIDYSLPLQTNTALEKFHSLPAHIASCFHLHKCHIFITAAAIAVRCIAPLIQSKASDPAVLVMDQRGKYVISLLSGHLGGGNDLATHIACCINGTPVITTATDVEGLPAIDVIAQTRNMHIANPIAIKQVSSALLAQRHVALHDPDDALGLAACKHARLFTSSLPLISVEEFLRNCAPDLPGICVSMYQLPLHDHCLVLHPRQIFAGMGCRKNTPLTDLLSLIHTCFAESNLALHSLAGFSSIDAKRGEAGFDQIATHFNLPFIYFSAENLAAFPVSKASIKVREQFGIDGVCEPSALAAVAARGGKGVLFMAKRSQNNATLALAY